MELPSKTPTKPLNSQTSHVFLIPGLRKSPNRRIFRRQRKILRVEASREGNLWSRVASQINPPLKFVFNASEMSFLDNCLNVLKNFMTENLECHWLTYLVKVTRNASSELVIRSFLALLNPYQLQYRFKSCSIRWTPRLKDEEPSPGWNHIYQNVPSITFKLRYPMNLPTREPFLANYHKQVREF